jgi:hypothetical protein
MKAVIAVLLFLLVQLPSTSATCPYDGDLAYFKKTVGFGKDRVCWYQHDHFDTKTIKTAHHEFYQPCPE